MEDPAMSIYVGIDVHRKRSQVAVVTGDGTVQLNKNVVNGTETLLRLIGDLPTGTPVASGAASGWGWLVRLLEDYGFEAHLVHPLRCKAIASARLKNDKVDAAVPGVRRHLRGHRETPREEDRHRDRPQAADPRLAPAQPDGTGRSQHAAAAAMKTGGPPGPPGALALAA
jgi:transposase